MSGHSKWAQIKHKKAITDVKKGKVFSRLVREIMVAGRTGPGGASPESNVRLRAAIERARMEGVPKDNIERAIQRGAGTGTGQEFKEFLYEATGPGGFAILIEGMSDNTNRTINEIKHLLVKHAGRLAEPGALVWNFEKIGILEVTAQQNPQQSKETLELIIIESGASDFVALDSEWIIETPFASRESVRKALEAKGVTIKESGHDYKPANTIVLDPADQKAAQTLLDVIAEYDDVQEVYTNLHI
ncbi:MAG: YebC/PmpR family DNA-binding transcriptional regulator [Candidatus Sungbacteria bacterium]|nr:YebC/PmpR family DNA-binding transcriptional regulator [bacterium]MDZ4260038.1 YebC/PmpR family DNA-binding transcriptional regulator [Candidatus Sungbacteria bacterium]